jgi:hypothetical protein
VLMKWLMSQAAPLAEKFVARSIARAGRTRHG